MISFPSVFANVGVFIRPPLRKLRAELPTGFRQTRRSSDHSIPVWIHRSVIFHADVRRSIIALSSLVARVSVTLSQTYDSQRKDGRFLLLCDSEMFSNCSWTSGSLLSSASLTSDPMTQTSGFIEMVLIH